MIQEYGSFAESWASSWGTSWGRKPVADALERSGVTRLWMYDLYSKAIEEDHKKRDINQPIEQPAPVVAAKPATKPKTRRARRAVAKLNPKPAHKPLPIYAPAFVKPVYTQDIIDILSKFAPLPRLHVAPRVKKIEKSNSPISIKKAKRQKKDLEFLLLLAA